MPKWIFGTRFQGTEEIKIVATFHLYLSTLFKQSLELMICLLFYVVLSKLSGIMMIVKFMKHIHRNTGLESHKERYQILYNNVTILVSPLMSDRSFFSHSYCIDHSRGSLYVLEMLSA